MIMSYIREIKKYILFLKNKCNLSITLQPVGDEHLISSSELMAFNIHDNSYCIFIKTHPQAQKHCVDCQKKIIAKLKDESFCGTCYAGVKERVYPICDGTKNVGFLCVSGYKTDNASSYISAVSEKYNIKRDSLENVYNFLKPTVPSEDESDALVMPLLRMFELAYIKLESEHHTEEPLINSIIHHVERYHTRDIGIDELCAEFSCSRSYLSHEFKKNTGKSFNEFVTDIRLRDAKLMLRNSRLSVTEIAFSVGYSDSNYFSAVFRKKIGMSPREYRKGKILQYF